MGEKESQGEKERNVVTQQEGLVCTAGLTHLDGTLMRKHHPESLPP